MGLTPGGLAEIERKKKTVEQLILDPNVFIADFPVDPFTPYIHTNNFIQQGVNRLLGYDFSVKKWRRIATDDGGWLYTIDRGHFWLDEPDALTSSQIGELRIDERHFLMNMISGHDLTEWLVFDSVSVPGTSLITHEAVDVSDAHKVSILLSTTTNCTVYIQGSDDNVNFYELKSDADVDLTWNCTNEKIWFRVLPTTRYLRVAVYNSAAGAATVRGVIHGQA